MTKTLEKRIINTVRRAVAESVHSVFSDPDYGLELTPQASRRLANYRRTRKPATISLEKILKSHR